MNSQAETTVSPEVIAHRGASHDAPENTRAAFQLGWDQGADAGELDIQLSKDARVVVMHDLSTQRTAAFDKPVAQQTLAELKQLEVGSWKHPQWMGEKIPTLEEALKTIPPGKRMFIELKSGPEILPALEPVLQAATQKPGQLVLIAFDYETMRLAKARFPAHQAYWLVSYKKDSGTGKFPQIDDLILKTKAAGLDGLNLSCHFPIDAVFVAKIKAAGMKVYVWTVDDPSQALRLKVAGVNGITTNRPAWIRERLESPLQR